MQACRNGLRRQRHDAASCRRLLSVVAWGRNAEGQCGCADRSPLITEPAQLDTLAGGDVASLAAGGLHSAAVLTDGHVLTWGSGKAGKLGHGVADNFTKPTRVEALVDRSDIAAVALGQSHTLFLDSAGGVWSCGENKEGQCGLGTPLGTLARQRRQEWTMGANMATFAQAYAEVTQSSAADSNTGLDSGGGGDSSHSSWHHNAYGAYLQPFRQHKRREEDLELARQMTAGAASLKAMGGDSVFGEFPDTSGRQSLSRAAGDSVASAAGLLGRMSGLMPGQHHSPRRMASDLHPLMALHSEDEDAAAAGAAAGSEARQDIGSQRVTGVAASNYFSLMLTSTGTVWAAGGGFNGELGQSSSWLTSASEVTGPVREALAENGGAIAVECGSTFSMALTTSGLVVIWGSPPGSTFPAGSRRSGGVAVVEMVGLPPMRHIAAGHSHALMSDGQRVWKMGSWLTAAGTKTGTQWGVPEVVAGLPDGVSGIAAGARASAVIDATGQLWMFGRLMAQDNARALIQQTTGRAASVKEAAAWMFAGMGSDEGPMRVPGLGKVASIQLGSAHALALVQ